LTGLTDAALTLKFTKGGEGFHLQVLSSGGDHSFWGTTEGLGLVRQGLKRDLDLVKERVMHSAREDGFVEFGPELDEALEVLHGKGLDVLAQMVGAGPCDVTSLARLLRRVLGSRPRTDAPIVQVIAPQNLWAPVELLAAPVDRIRIRNDRQLKAACARFLGFAAVIQHVIPRDETGESLGLLQDRDRKLEADPSLPLLFFQDDSLAGARAEYERLKALSGLTVHGPWPSSRHRVANPIRMFVDRLGDPRLRLGSRRLEKPIQIQHFACHCDTRSTRADDHALRLQSGGAKPMDFSISQIRRERTRAAQLAAYRPVHDQSDVPLPVVFLNACSSSVIDHVAAASFPELFLSGGSRGFIGTLTDIPDVFAGRFAAHFYEHLLGGAKAGQALNAAKWDMVTEKQNPLGILYAMFADPDLAVRRNEEDSHDRADS
jgi:hypothetical protein